MSSNIVITMARQYGSCLLYTSSISSLLTGLLVPLCTYIILAVSLNLVVGMLGELSLGHTGFMCVGAFSNAFFSKCM